jgi:membrane protease YdiL (CAAX protease family)
LDQPTAVETDKTVTRREPWPLWLHFVVVLGLQAAYAWWYVHSPWLRAAILVPSTVRLVFWTLPVLVFLALERRPILGSLRMRDNAFRGMAWGGAIGALILIANAVAQCAFRGSCRMNFHFGLHLWVGPVALVGLSEKVLFRGFFLQKLSDRMGFARSNCLQALLFLLIHFPGWILMGQFHFPAILRPVANVLFIALFNGWILRRTRSLWACMIIHSFNNLATFANR